jgi:hypothetical protein
MPLSWSSFFQAIAHPHKWPEEGERITTSVTSRTAGSAFERVRNLVEYEEEHLLRRNAIRRMLRRRLDTPEVDEEGVTRGLSLLRELIWAKYLPNSAVPLDLASGMDAVLLKYDPLFAALPKGEALSQAENWLLDIESTEIEYLLQPPRAAEALGTLMFATLKEQMEWKGEGLPEAHLREFLLFIAVHRALLKSNLATLRYRVFSLYVPEWSTASAHMAAEQVAPKLPALMGGVDALLDHEHLDALTRFVRRYAFVFWVLEDVAREAGAGAEALFEKPEALSKAVATAAEKRYKVFSLRLRRTVLRAVVFLFLTKMLLALLLELPYDLFVLGHVLWIPLAINVVFHPFFLVLIGSTVHIPKESNTKRLQELVRVAVTGEGDLHAVFRVRSSSVWLARVFNWLYACTYAVSYGVIAWVLALWGNFTGLSIGLFLFFFSLVTFFGIKIRQSAREILVVERQGSFFGSVFDAFLLPLVRVGHWVSLRAPKVNIFLFFLDFVVEAPLKMAIDVAEGWMAFLREKKEEIEG